MSTEQAVSTFTHVWCVVCVAVLIAGVNNPHVRLSATSVCVCVCAPVRPVKFLFNINLILILFVVRVADVSLTLKGSGVKGQGSNCHQFSAEHSRLD